MQDTPFPVTVSGQQRFELRRAHQFYLPLLSQRVPQPDAEAPEPTSTVQVMPTAKAQLRGVLYSHGEHRGGPLFGKRGEPFEIHHAHLGGYSSLLKHDPLACSAEYLLGLTDAYRQCQPELDWVGHWLVWPNRRQPNLTDALEWIERAHELSLVSEEHCFFIVSWDEGRLSGSVAFAETDQRECRWVIPNF